MAVTLPGNGYDSAQALRPSTTQTATTLVTSSAITNAVGARTEVIRVVCSVDAYIAIAASPTATTSSMLIPAFAVEYFRVEPGSDKVASLRVGSSDGVLFVTEMN